MTVDWSQGGPEFLVTIDRTGPPLSGQIQDQLRQAIRHGRLTAGERLPSTRRLSEQLAVSRGTVVDVYEQLLAEGYVESAIGSGTRVAEVVGTESHRSAPCKAAPSVPRPAVDFEYGIPDLGSFPLTDWIWALSEATRSLPTAELGDEKPGGSSHLRQVVTAYHRRVRAGCAVADDAVVVSGFRQGLVFALAALSSQGIESVALEDPGPRGHDAIALRAGLDVVPVPVDAEGVDVGRLRETSARAVVVTPPHQCPTGVALSPSRRKQLITWANEVDGVILEDDYDAEFRYDRQPVGSLQGLDGGRVIALGSVSKTLAPAIKLGWVLAPPRFLAGIIEEKELASRGAPALDQEALALLMESGRFDRHLRRMKAVYRARRDVLAAEVTATFGTDHLQGLAAGCHALLRLPDGVSEETIEVAARARSVNVNGLGRYRLADADGLPAPGLVLGFGNLTEHQIRRGVRALAEAVRHCTSPTPAG
jgi:GntR family transcriptional regulator/MocR family aminotransferase